MKKLLSALLSSAILLSALSGCEQNPSSITYDYTDGQTSEVTESTLPTAKDGAMGDSEEATQTKGTNIVPEITIETERYTFDDRKYDKEVTISDPYCTGNQTGVVNYAALSDKLKMDCSVTSVDSYDILVKILAGDADFDIYIINATDVRKLLQAGIFSPIESEAIKKFNEGCFDYISDFAKDNNGEVFVMPVTSYVSSLIYSDDTAKEAGFTREELLYYDSMVEFVKNYKGTRKAYTTGTEFFNSLESQYEQYYCDFENKEFDYMTDTYRKIYSTLEGWKRYGESPTPKYFENGIIINPLNDYEKILFLEKNLNGFVGSIYTTIEGARLTVERGDFDESYLEQFLTEDEIGKWRIAPMPRIDSTIDKNKVNVMFAYINPYSQNKENAVRMLEELAANFFDYLGAYPCTYLFEDEDIYPENYLPGSQLFADIYDICKNGYISAYQVNTAHGDIEEYQNGRATLDEAIEMYQREVNIWLNE